MPPRIHVCLQCLRISSSRSTARAVANRSARCASAQAIAPAPPHEQMSESFAPVFTHPHNQPPSHRRPEDRRSQLHRQYTSLLRSTPMMILFQHNNLKATEWMSIRRELAIALQKVDKARSAAGHQNDTDLASSIRIQILQTGIFGAALRVVEYYHPEPTSQIHPSDPKTRTSTPVPDSSDSALEPAYTHGLSRNAYVATRNHKLDHALAPLLSGPLAAVTFPTVSTEHLKAVLSVLSPASPAFPAPSRRLNPGYWDQSMQLAVQKMLLLGGRVEGRVFDTDGTRWVGKIEGGMDGLRSQLVAMLQGLGASVAGTLEAAGRSLYFTMEGRKEMLEKEAGRAEEDEKEEKKAEP